MVLLGKPATLTRPMLIALLADTHLPRGRRALPERALELMRSSDLIIHAGDFVSDQVLAAIEALGPPVHGVHGNMDSPALCKRLPRETLVEAGDARIGIVHDAGPVRGRLARLRKRFPRADAVVFGHSHLPLHERAGRFQIFNPGSPTERRRARNHTMGLARVEGRRIEFELVVLD
jgi:putative phosphoesterase